MRNLIAALATTVMLAGPAFAAQVEGHIKSINRDDLTITLDDGKSYKLNAETDLEALKPGMDIVIAYDETNGENVITDMQLPDSGSSE